MTERERAGSLDVAIVAGRVTSRLGEASGERRATRRSVHEPWSPPENLGTPLNTAAGETQPTLSYDGRTLIFASTRPGGLGGSDIWMSTRTPSGH